MPPVSKSVFSRPKSRRKSVGLPASVFASAAAMRRQDHGLAVGKHLVQQAAVLRLGFFALAEPGLLKVDLILQRQAAFVVGGPNRPAHRRQRRDDAVEESAVKLFRRNVLLGQLRNFRHQRADLLLGLFDQIRI